MKASQISMLIGFGKEMAKAGPPPEVVGTTVAEAQSWEGTLLGRRERRLGKGRRSQQRLAGHRDEAPLRVGRQREEGRGPRRARHERRASSAGLHQGSPRSRGHSARSALRRSSLPARSRKPRWTRRRVVQEPGRGRGGARGPDRPQGDPRSLHRQARHSRRQHRSVPGAPARASRSSNRPTRCSPTSRCLSATSRS